MGLGGVTDLCPLVHPPPPPPPSPPFATASSSSTADCLQCPYPYSPQLLAMSALTPLEPPRLPKELWTITSPLQLKSWQTLLKSHPDTQFAEYILSGIQSGFRVGFSYDRCNLKARKRNMLSVFVFCSVLYVYGCMLMHSLLGV